MMGPLQRQFYHSSATLFRPLTVSSKLTHGMSLHARAFSSHTEQTRHFKISAKHFSSSTDTAEKPDSSSDKVRKYVEQIKTFKHAASEHSPSIFETLSSVKDLDTFETVLDRPTHCGIYQKSSKLLMLIGPCNTSKYIEGCLAMHVYNDVLYTLEKNPFNPAQCLLNMRKLTNDKDVMGRIEKTLALNVPQATFSELRDNKNLILLSDNHSEHPEIDVNLNSLEIIYRKELVVTHKFLEYLSS